MSSRPQLAPTIVALLLCALPSLAQAQGRACTLRGAGELPHVRVRPRGATPFELSVTDRPVAVTATRSERARVRATSGLIFEGEMASGDVPIALGREVRVAHGVLTLRPGTAISVVSLRRRAVAVELDDDVRVASVTVPCDALRVGPAAAASELPPDAPEAGALLSRGEALHVHARPGGPALTVEAAGLRLAEVARRGGWVRVRRDFFDGSTLQGWVREAELERVPEEPFAEIGHGYGMGGLGLCGTGGAHAYRGPATLVAGAQVREAREGVAWARAAEDVEVRVYFLFGAEWAQLTRVEGLRDYEGCTQELDRAWVPVASLRFPPGARGVPASQVAPAHD